MVVITRRLAQIDHFYHKNWNDYRIQQILRSRKLLIDFTKQYHHLLATEEPEEPARELEPSSSRQDFTVFQEKDRSVSRGSYEQIDGRHEQSERRHELLDRSHLRN